MGTRFKPVGVGDRTYLKPGSYEVIEGTWIKEESSEFGPNYHISTTDKGVVILNSTRQMVYLFSQINIGDYIRLTYKGKKRMEKGPNKGKDAHQFELEVSEDTQEGDFEAFVD
jgi:hypothetical protein